MSRYARRVLILQGWLVVIAGTIVLPVVLGLSMDPEAAHALPMSKPLLLVVILSCVLLAKWLHAVWRRTPSDPTAGWENQRPAGQRVADAALPWAPLIVFLGGVAVSTMGGSPPGLTGLPSAVETAAPSRLQMAVADAEQALAGRDLMAISGAAAVFEEVAPAPMGWMTADARVLQSRVHAIREDAKLFVRSYVESHSLADLGRAELAALTPLLERYGSADEAAVCRERLIALQKAAKPASRASSLPTGTAAPALRPLHG